MKSTPPNTRTLASNPTLKIAPKPTLKRKLPEVEAANGGGGAAQNTYSAPSWSNHRQVPSNFAPAQQYPSKLPAVPQPQLPASTQQVKESISYPTIAPCFGERFSGKPNDDSFFSPDNRYAWCVAIESATPAVVLRDLHAKRSMLLTDTTDSTLSVRSERCKLDHESYDRGLFKDFYGRIFTNDSRHFCMYSMNRILIWKLPVIPTPRPSGDLNEPSKTDKLPASKELYLVSDTATYEQFTSCAWMKTDSFLIGHIPKFFAFVALDGKKDMLQWAPSHDRFPGAPHSQSTHGNVLCYLKTHKKTVMFYQIKDRTMSIAPLQDFDASKITGEFSIVNNGKNILLVSESYSLYAWHHAGASMKPETPPQVQGDILKIIHNPDSPYVGIVGKPAVRFFTYDNGQWQAIRETIVPRLLGYISFTSNTGSLPHSMGQNPHVFRLLNNVSASVPFWVNYDATYKRIVTLTSMLGDTAIPLARCAFSAGDMQVAVAEKDAVVLWDLSGNIPRREKILPWVPKLEHFTSFNLVREANTLLAWADGHVALLTENAEQWTVLKLPASVRSFTSPALSKSNDLITFTTDGNHAYVMGTAQPNEPGLSPPAVTLTSGQAFYENPITSRFTPEGSFVLVRFGQPKARRGNDALMTEGVSTRWAREQISGKLFDLTDAYL